MKYQQQYEDSNYTIGTSILRHISSGKAHTTLLYLCHKFRSSTKCLQFIFFLEFPKYYSPKQCTA